MQYFILKGIDKYNKVCYNIDTVKERNKDLKKEVDFNDDYENGKCNRKRNRNGYGL